MARRVWILLVLVALGVPALGWAQGRVTVMVLPFEINAREDLGYLRVEIPKNIRENLAANGATIREASAEAVPGDHEALRRLGVEAGVDYLVWGSLTWVGERFSIDAQYLEPFAETPVSALSVDGQGIETLSGKLAELSQELAIRFFKLARIAEIRVSGNQRIETDAIQRVLQVKPGQTYLPKAISEDLRAVFKMGYFDDVRVTTQDRPDGRIVTFVVTEKPTILGIGISGNEAYDDDKILESLTIKTGSVLNLNRVRVNVGIIEQLYREKNYHNVKVAYQVNPLENNQVNLEFSVEEGEKISIERIAFQGNQTFSEKELKKQIQSSERGWFSWITDSGELDREKLNQDVIAITNFYQDQGFINVKVADPEVAFQPDGIEVTFKVAEGDRYKVGQVDVAGDLIRDKTELLAGLQIKTDDYFNRSLLQRDVLNLTDLYGDQGYAYASVAPRVSPDPAAKTVAITLDIDKGALVYFEEILIGGNTRTRDKVIRRQLQVYEKELYHRGRLKDGIQNLHRLNYFEDIKVNTLKGATDDSMILKIDVAEKPTGTLTFGGGFSSVDNVFGVISLEQRNLFGRGQILNLKANVSGTATRFDLNFVEPWLFDIPLAAGINLYNWEREYDDYGYDKDSYGAAFSLAYPVWRHTLLTGRYLFDVSDVTITDFQEASDSIKDLVGENTTSSFTTTLRYDSRDHPFHTTRGAVHEASVEYAGLGGDIEYIKYIAETGYYVPLFWVFTGHARAVGGYIDETGLTPDWERFFLGGISTLRGVKPKDISPREDENDPDSPLLGGEKMVLFSAELLFPIGKDWGLQGVVFMDAGDVYITGEDYDLGNLVKTAGGGLRWFSPLGPLRLEYGFVVDDGGTEASGGRFEFTMGSQF
jgi:outer membrane protein insertion porin family